jgi:hypothetical protein
VKAKRFLCLVLVLLSGLTWADTWDVLLAQLPEEFEGRNGAVFTRKVILKFRTSLKNFPYVKVKFETNSPPFLSTWVMAVDSEDRANRREFWEVLGDAEPKMQFEPGVHPSEVYEEPFRFVAALGEDGLMSVFAETKTRVGRSQYLNAKKEYQKSVEYFGSERVRGISSYWPNTWEIADNLTAFYGAVLAPTALSPERAAFETHEGRQAQKFGFTVVRIAEETVRQIEKKRTWPFDDVSVTFLRPL